MEVREFLKALEGGYPFANLERLNEDSQAFVLSLVDIGYLEITEEIAPDALRSLLESYGAPTVYHDYHVTPEGLLYIKDGE